MLIGNIVPTEILLPFVGVVVILLNISKGDNQNFKLNVFTNLMTNKKELKGAKQNCLFFDNNLLIKMC